MVQDTKKCLTFIDLFAGAGGLSEGFLHHGYTPIAHVEMNPEACRTLETRACYYYLKAAGKQDLYQKYLQGETDRQSLFQDVPCAVTKTVINQTMREDNIQILFDTIDALMTEQENDHVDIVVGGPPCQAYSIIGRSRAKDGMEHDKRNYLYLLYSKVLEKYNPRMFVFENVPGLLTAQGGKHYRDMKAEFKRVGYIIDDRILCAQDFGVLQNRQRVVLIGWRQGMDYAYPDFPAVRHSCTVQSLFDDLPVLEPGGESRTYAKPANGYIKEYGIRDSKDVLTWDITRPTTVQDREIYRLVIREWNEKQRRLKYTDLPAHLRTHKNMDSFTDRFKVVAADLPYSHTMVAHIAKDGHYFIHPDIRQARSISVREAARIQSFPDNFFFEGSRTSVFTQIGNAVPPLMARGIAEKLKEELER